MEKMGLYHLYPFSVRKRGYTDQMKLLFYVLWTLGVSRTASYEITHVCLVICLSGRPSVTKFSQVWVISFFSDIAHDDRWVTLISSD